MIAWSGADLVVAAIGVSAVIAAGYSIHRALKSIRAWVKRMISIAAHEFSQAVDASSTGQLVKHHLGPNGTTTPIHERVGAIERSQAEHNGVASTRWQENARKLMDISARLIAVEKAQKTAASVAEDTEARHQGEQT